MTGPNLSVSIILIWHKKKVPTCKLFMKMPKRHSNMLHAECDANGGKCYTESSSKNCWLMLIWIPESTKIMFWSWKPCIWQIHILNCTHFFIIIMIGVNMPGSKNFAIVGSSSFFIPSIWDTLYKVHNKYSSFFGKRGGNVKKIRLLFYFLGVLGFGYPL